MTDEFLDWLCWVWAKDGERFYPPDETAWECMEAVMDGYMNDYDVNDPMLTLTLIKAYQWERGQHSRAYMEAHDRFDDAQRYGLDPVERAAREHRALMNRADGDVEPLDWEWRNIRNG